LKLLTLSDFSQVGGAAIAANRISNSLSKKNVSVTSVSLDARHKERNSSKLLLGRKFLFLEQLLSSSRFSSILVSKLKNREWCKQFSLLLNRGKPDAIHIHNIHSAPWPIDMVKTALNHAPVVWTLHDCWSFLGSFYPRHSTPPPKLLKKQIDSFWSTLRSKPSRQKLCATTPSYWMKQEAQKHEWSGYEVNSIHNPVPDFFFADIDRKACKQALSLDESKTTILCVAGNLDEERKGGVYLKDILNTNWGEDVQFLTVGSGCISSSFASQPRNLGFIQDELTLRIAYNASDLLLHPAPIDNLPNTVAESMSCGTPVLAFNTGGLPEMVVPHRSGWLVEEMNSNAIIEQLNSVLQSKQVNELRKFTKETARILFNEKKATEDYFKAFKHALSK
jgi:glycosyltransferase involved in cell wall biosynthesis